MQALSLVGLSDMKRVVNTPWWPPGTEKTAESVGIVSGATLFMTGMMEANQTINETVGQELRDVADIAVAAGTNLSSLVSCLVNTPRGSRGAEYATAFERRLRPFGVALTFVETAGEFAMFDSSATCTAVKGVPKRVRRVDGATSVVAAGLAHVSVSAPSAAAAIERLLGAAGTDAASLVDCLAFVGDRASAAALRSELLRRGARPTLSLVVSPASRDDHAFRAQCVASTEGPATRRGMSSPGAAAAAGLVWLDGATGVERNGSDALAAAGVALRAAGTSLDLVLSCLFFATSAEYILPLFGTFYQVFNVEHAPPPARAEFVAPAGFDAAGCGNCSILAKCVAAHR